MASLLKALTVASVVKRAQLHSVPERGWHRIIDEPFSGAWQMNAEEKRGTLICYPTLYACLMRIATDIGTLPFQLKVRDRESGVWKDAFLDPFSTLLRSPNHYQTAQQFREAWILSKLQHGNTYVLKGRDERGAVTRLYVLDPCRVLPMVADSGDVFYQINYPEAANLLPADYPNEQLTIPASEIIHDRCVTLHHQLIGVPPLCAAYWPAVKNLKILKNSSSFFGNGANPGGILTAPAGMSDTDAAAVKEYWNTNFSEDNSGKVAVIGADMKFTSFAFKAADSQLVEQMRYSDEQICQPFGVPPFIIGIGNIPGGMKVDDMMTMYHRLALSSLIESMEWLLDAGLGIQFPYGVELDTEPLLRMDVGKQADVITQLITGKAITPDEGRKRLGYGATSGGDTIWGQHQDYPLGMLRDRNDMSSGDASTDVQAEALNGAQVTAMQGVMLAMASGELAVSTARAIIQAAFPLITPAQLDAMFSAYVGENAIAPGEEARALTASNTIKAVEAMREAII